MALVTHAVMQPTVLLVEDDPDLRGAMAEALQDVGYEVAMAINSREALRVLVSLEVPCLVLVDLETPRVQGLGLLETLGKDSRFAQSRVVVMCAEPKPCPEGVVALLRKPVRLKDLLAAVQAHCPGPRPEVSRRVSR
ncbi:response regulator [Myxococcus qinghaiensis]|uniref:response regulator n=1 Tax=Myxococcus qinghaiensis TaxID=2906758 RepID=UPI0020A77EE3|nr:response regulator [Myxococcus qinghaiensis]MCP3169012.1 response regulator [Myxococcus qinghaiensis]